ncbi:MAG: TIM barrel protein [Verrucomicrobiales bacterium]|nr:TIM barrel protein [Verrucomicrobiales bacterium]
MNRRSFLKCSAIPLTSVPLVVSGSQDSNKNPNFKGQIYKALKGGKKTGESVEAFFLRLKGLGYDGVESGNAGEAEAYRAAAKKTGIRVHGLVNGGHWSVRLSDPNPEVRLKGRKNLENALMNTHLLGGSSVLLVPGKVGGANETHDHVWERSIEQVRAVIPLASRLGVRVLIETVWNGFCESPEKFRDYIDEFNSPWVGAYFDIGNMQKFAPAEEWIRTLGNRTVKLDVKDWGKKNGFCRLGEGDVDWEKVRVALHEIGFSGWATREGSDKSLEDTSQLIDDLVIGI